MQWDRRKRNTTNISMTDSKDLSQLKWKEHYHLAFIDGAWIAMCDCPEAHETAAKMNKRREIAEQLMRDKKQERSEVF